MRQITLGDLKQLALDARGGIDRIYLHWSAGRYTQLFDDYHININGDGDIFASVDDLTEHLSHTWKRNSRAVGVSIACCLGATTNDLGDYAPTQAQIETLAMVVACLCKYLGLDATYAAVRTHSEQADEDDYGPRTTCERWDLLFISNDSKDTNGGDVIRGKANFYLQTNQV